MSLARLRARPLAGVLGITLLMLLTAVHVDGHAAEGQRASERASERAAKSSGARKSQAERRRACRRLDRRAARLRCARRSSCKRFRVKASRRQCLRRSACKSRERAAARRRCLKRARRNAPVKRARADRTPPRVRFLSPRHAQSVSGRLRNPACKVAAGDDVGVSRVTFFVNGKRLRVQRKGPWSCGALDTTRLPDGPHALRATAHDRAGNSASARVKVVVRNGALTQDPSVLPDGCENPHPYPAPLHSRAPGPEGDVSRAFVDPTGCKITVNGFNMFPVWQREPARYQRHYDEIAAKGFTGVRFIMPWSHYEPQRGEYVGLDALDQAVVYAREAGLYVVLDMIHSDEWNRSPAWARTDGSDGDGAAAMADVLANAKPWVQTVARRYQDNPTVAAYDLMNEPRTNDQNRVLRLYDRMISWVREVDPEKIVMTEAGFGNTSMAPRYVDPSNLSHRRNVVHTSHDYYAGDGNPATVFDGYNRWGMSDGHQVWNGVGGYPNQGDQADFHAQLQVQMDYARRAGLAYWIGEFGINSQAQNSLAWVEDKVAAYERYGLGRAWWLYACQSDGLGIQTDGCGWKPHVDALR